MTPTQTTHFQKSLLAWYTSGHRPMPWRDTQNPYHIWLAEVMLQQTTVAAVIPYYQRFLAKFPTIQSLAAADISEILHLWQGLGYYRRAHLLHTCAKTITEKYAGKFPNTEEQLLTLPGLGPYTAAVIAATAFNTPATVVDGNVERVTSRLFTVTTPLPAAKPILRQYAAKLASHDEPRLYANAIMELGATICTPKNPRCNQCPVSQFCLAFKEGNPAQYPFKSTKKKLPHHHATTYLLQDNSGHIYLRQRPVAGLLGGLWELPHTGWETTPLPKLPLTNPQPRGSITHTFTHFKLTLNVVQVTSQKLPAENRFTPTNLPPLSTLMKKALARALEGSGPLFSEPSP